MSHSNLIVRECTISFLFLRYRDVYKVFILTDTVWGNHRGYRESILGTISSFFSGNNFGVVNFFKPLEVF